MIEAQQEISECVERGDTIPTDSRAIIEEILEVKPETIASEIPSTDTMKEYLARMQNEILENIRREIPKSDLKELQAVVDEQKKLARSTKRKINRWEVLFKTRSARVIKKMWSISRNTVSTTIIVSVNITTSIIC